MSQTLSPSSINTFYRCPRLFYYNYILKKRSPPNIHLYKGNFIHKILEDLYDKSSCPDLDVFFNERMTKWNPPKVVIDNTDDIEFHKKETELILKHYATRIKDKLEMLLFQGKAKARTHAWNLIRPKLREFRITDKNLNLVGIIDAVETNFENKTYLIDYKTSSLYRHTMGDDYIRQITIYAYLYFVKFGELPDYVGVDYVRYSDVFFVPVRKEMLEEVKEYVKFVRENTQSTNIEDYPQCNQKFCDCHYFEKKEEKNDA